MERNRICSYSSAHPTVRMNLFPFFFSGMPTDLSWELVLFRASMKRRGKWKGFLLALAKLCPEALRNLSRGLGNAAQGLSTCLA
jgi:hypothetical protein